MAALALAAVAVALLMPLPVSLEARYGPAGGASLHGLLFSGLAWMVGLGLPERGRGWALWVALLAFSAGLERLQPLVGRSAELADWLYGAAGAACICATGRLKHRTVIRWVGLLALSLFPLAWEVAMVHLEVRAFPVLADSALRWSRRGWTSNAVRISSATPGGFRVEAAAEAKAGTPGIYPGLFRPPACADWRGTRALRAELFWPAPEPAVFAIRVDDQSGNPAYAERFQREFSVTQGWNSVRIPAAELGWTSGGRPLRLDTIRHWGVFLVSNTPLDYFLLGPVSLELPPESP